MVVPAHLEMCKCHTMPHRTGVRTGTGSFDGSPRQFGQCEPIQEWRASRELRSILARGESDDCARTHFWGRIGDENTE